MNSFAELKLCEPLLKAIAAEGYDKPTPIQSRAIPELLAGRDLLGIAQTGTGKTAAFALPILDRLAQQNQRPARRSCRALILSPTRELASQIGDSFKAYGRNMKFSSVVVFGGVNINKQINILRNGVDVLVATPGRLVDLIERNALTLSDVKIFVLDEVDQMLDLGFIHAIRKITGLLPPVRQNLFFSATMPKEIAGLADGLLKSPARVEVAPVATTVDRVSQNVIHVEQGTKLKLLNELLRDISMYRTLVFTRTKHGADKVVKGLSKSGYTVVAIHGNKSQSNRERALAGFKAGKIRVLVATDIAARGIDIDNVTHVVNYDLPHVPESYVHRIGRTARAGAEGIAIAFCSPDERPLLRDIERTIRQQITVKEHELSIAPPQPGERQHRPPQRPQQHQGKRPHRGGKSGWTPRNNAQGEQREQRQNQNRNHQAGKPAHANSGTAAPKRSGKPSWMKQIGGKGNNRSRPAVRFGS